MKGWLSRPLLRYCLFALFCTCTWPDVILSQNSISEDEAKRLHCLATEGDFPAGIIILASLYLFDKDLSDSLSLSLSRVWAFDGMEVMKEAIAWVGGENLFPDLWQCLSKLWLLCEDMMIIFWSVSFGLGTEREWLRLRFFSWRRCWFWAPTKILLKFNFKEAYIVLKTQKSYECWILLKSSFVPRGFWTLFILKSKPQQPVVISDFTAS